MQICASYVRGYSKSEVSLEHRWNGVTFDIEIGWTSEGRQGVYSTYVQHDHPRSSPIVAIIRIVGSHQFPLRPHFYKIPADPLQAPLYGIDSVISRRDSTFKKDDAEVTSSLSGLFKIQPLRNHMNASCESSPVNFSIASVLQFPS